jgi:hypothetical protein
MVAQAIIMTTKNVFLIITLKRSKGSPVDVGRPWFGILAQLAERVSGAKEIQ